MEQISQLANYEAWTIPIAIQFGPFLLDQIRGSTAMFKNRLLIQTFLLALSILGIVSVSFGHSNPPILSGIISDTGQFVVAVSISGQDAFDLASKLGRLDSTSEMKSTQTFTVFLAGSLKSGLIFEVKSKTFHQRSLPGGTNSVEEIAFSMPLYTSEFSLGEVVGWQKKNGVGLEFAQGQDLFQSLLGKTGKFQGIQNVDEKSILDLILSPTSTIKNLSAQRRLVGFFWDESERRLIRVDEPVQRLEHDYTSKSR